MTENFTHGNLVPCRNNEECFFCPNFTGCASKFQRLLTGDTICPHQVARTATTARRKPFVSFQNFYYRTSSAHGQSGVDRRSGSGSPPFPELAWSRAHGTGAASRPGRSIYVAGDAQRTDFFRARAGPGRARGCHAQGPGRAVALAFSRNDALACPADSLN